MSHFLNLMVFHLRGETEREGKKEEGGREKRKREGGREGEGEGGGR